MPASCAVGATASSVLPADGFVGAVYVHEMARSGDPHLHAHLVIANRVRGPDGRWSAPDMRPVYAHAKTAGTIADAVMRAELTRSLGVEWGPVVNGIAELAAVPASVREHFSARHAEIVEEALARGLTSRAGIAAIQRETRDRKRSIAREEAVAGWRARAAEHGFGARELRDALGRARPVTRPDYTERLRAQAARMLGPEGLTRQSSTFTRREVIQALGEVHPEGAPAGRLEALADQFLAERCVALTREDGDAPRSWREPLFTTQDMLRTEVRLVDAATGRDPGAPIDAEPEAIEAVIAARPTLGADQAAAVRHLCGGEARVRVMEARAGSGKTFTLSAVRDAYERSGVRVIGVAWQGQAADLLRREAGIESQTAALLLRRIERGESAIPARGLIVVDEASAMPTRALQRLVHAAAWRSARVVLVGDRAQLPAIEAGGGFAALADRLGAVALTENRRQASELQRRIAAHLAEGRAADAVALLSESGRLQRFEDAREARAALVEAWAEAERESPGRSLMLAHDRHDVAELNRLARESREARGLLSERRLVAGGSEWAIGDRLVCRRNDYGLGVRNGTAGTVVRMDPLGEHLDVFTDHGEIVRLPAGYLGHARHGYALTGHVSQGESVDRTFVLASPDRGGAEWAYVAASRHRHDLQVFVVHHDAGEIETALARAWSRSQGKSLALDLVAPERRDAVMRAVRADVDGATPERLLALSEELRAEREAAQERLRATADERMRRVEATRRLELAESGLKEARTRYERLAEQLERTPAWRRRDRAELRADLARAGRDFGHHRAELRSARGDLDRVGPGDDVGERAQRLGAQLERVEERLAPWRGPVDPDRAHGIEDRSRNAPGRGLGRER